VKKPTRVGLKGAAGSGKTGDARTATSEVSEDRSERLDRSQPGLSCWTHHWRIQKSQIQTQTHID